MNTPAAPGNAADTVTILHARGRRLAKLVERDGTIIGYDLAKTFDMTEQPIADLDTLRGLLDHLLHQPDQCIVRGAVADPARARRVRRLLYRDPETGEVPTLRDVPRRWCALDIDGLARPETTPPADLWGCGLAALERLPAAFRGAGCIVQATGSHGIKPGLRLRVWCWLSRPTTGAELCRWLRGSPVDSSIFSPVQVIYTAAPLFAAGRAEHLPQRLATLPGPVVAVPAPDALRPPPAPAPCPLPAPGDTRAARYAFAALRDAAARLGAAGEGQRHPTMIREARALARFTTAGLLAEQDVRRALGEAADRAGKPSGEVEKAIAWAFAHPSPAPLPEAAR